MYYLCIHRTKSCWNRAVDTIVTTKLWSQHGFDKAVSSRSFWCLIPRVPRQEIGVQRAWLGERILSISPSIIETCESWRQTRPLLAKVCVLVWLPLLLEVQYLHFPWLGTIKKLGYGLHLDIFTLSKTQDVQLLVKIDEAMIRLDGWMMSHWKNPKNNLTGGFRNLEWHTWLGVRTSLYQWFSMS